MAKEVGNVYLAFESYKMHAPLPNFLPVKITNSPLKEQEVNDQNPHHF